MKSWNHQLVRRLRLTVPFRLRLLCVLAAASSVVLGQQQTGEFSYPKTVRLQYLLALPDNYASASDRRFPLVLFLHGGGESGNDLELLKKHGLPKLVAEGRKFPFVLLSPQNSGPRKFFDCEAIMALLDHIIATHRIDPKRVYVTGMSRGGYGAWSLAIQNPGRFAALAPVCGSTPSGYGPWLDQTPIWVFHGTRDDSIPVHESIQMVEELRRTNPNVKLTLYEDVGHNAWEKAYADPALYEWMLQQRLE